MRFLFKLELHNGRAIVFSGVNKPPVKETFIKVVDWRLFICGLLYILDEIAGDGLRLNEFDVSDWTVALIGQLHTVSVSWGCENRTWLVVGWTL